MLRLTTTTERIELANQHLPADFAGTLAALYLICGRNGGRHCHHPGYPLFIATLAAAKAKGWTYRALAEPLGLTRERIRQRLLQYDGSVDGLKLPEIPDPPRRSPLPERPTKPTISAGMAGWLRDMYKVAKLMRGSVRLDDPRRGINEAFTAVLADLQDRGVSAGTIAKAIGCRPQTIYFRLRRHGYRHIAPSQKPYRRMVTPNVANGKPRVAAPGDRFQAWLDQRQGPVELATMELPRPTATSTTPKSVASGGAS